MISIQDLDVITYKFTELGQAVADLSHKNNEMVDKTVGSLKDGFESMISGLMVSESFQEAKKLLVVNQTYVDALNDQMVGSLASINTSFDNLKKFTDTLEVTAQQAAVQETMGGPGGKKKEDEKDKAKKKENLLQREVSSIKGLINKGLSTLKIPLGLGVAAVAGGAMIMGYERRTRINAELGEMKNILVAMSGDASKALISKASGYLSVLQEDLQRLYGISKSDTQGVVTAFQEGGVTITEMLSKMDFKVHKLGSNFHTFSLSLDKMFNMAGGTTAREMTGLMADYGKDIKEASDTVFKMMMAGTKSGIGMQQFMKNVKGTADELKKYGFDVDDVIDLHVGLQDQFEKLGVPKKFAGMQAMVGLKQMASGMVNMSDSWKVFFAEKLGYGKGLEGRQNFMENFTRILRGNKTEELMDLSTQIAAVALVAGKGNEAESRRIMEDSIGMGFEGARSALMIKKAVDQKDFKKANKIAKEQMKALRKSFGIEREKTNTWQILLNRWLDNLSKIGETLLSMAIKTLASLIVTVKSWPAMLKVWFLKKLGLADESDEKKIEDILKNVIFSTAKEQEQFKKSLMGQKEVLKDMGMDILAGSIDAFSAALDLDMSSKLGFGLGGKPTPLSEERAPIVQTIVIPAGSESGSYPITTSDRPMGGGGAGREEESGWVGGDLSIISSGVDDSGNIALSLVGNCPRCGLIFGEGSTMSGVMVSGLSGISGFSALDQEALAMLRMGELGGAGEGEGVGIKAGAALNRWRRRGGKPGGLHEVITGGKGFGAQKDDGGRPFGTVERPKLLKNMPKYRDWAKDILSGSEDIEDPTKGKATHFYDAKSFRESKKGKRMAMPPFARPKKGGLVNVYNKPKGEGDWVRAYAPAGPGVTRAPDADKIDKIVTQDYQKVSGIQKHQEFKKDETRRAAIHAGEESRPGGVEPWEAEQYTSESEV